MGQLKHQPEHDGLDTVLEELRETGPLYNPRQVVPMWGPEMLVPDFWSSLHYYWLSVVTIHPQVHAAWGNLERNMWNLWSMTGKHPWLSFLGVSITAYCAFKCIYFRAILIPGLVIWGIRHKAE